MALYFVLIATFAVSMLQKKYPQLKEKGSEILYRIYFGATIILIIDAVYVYYTTGKILVDSVQENLLDGVLSGICSIIVGLLVWGIIMFIKKPEIFSCFRKK